MTITSIKASELPAIGQPLADGTFAYRYWLNGLEYAFIDLGAEREFIGEWGEYDQCVEGASSYRDGAANTAAMAEAGSPIAKQALGIGEGVFIPSALELQSLYAAKQAGEISGFQDRWYWSSSQRSAYGAYLMDFEGGWQDYYGKGYERQVRHVDILPVSCNPAHAMAVRAGQLVEHSLNDSSRTTVATPLNPDTRLLEVSPVRLRHAPSASSRR